MNLKKLKKHVYASLCISFLLVSIVEAQKGIIGVRYMPTVSSIKVQNYQGNDLTGEFMVGNGYGALLGVNINKHIGLQAEVIYNELSQKYKDDNLDRRININYVNVPILLSLNTNRNRIVNLNAVVGPQIGFNVGAALITTGIPNGNGSSTAVLAARKTDVGIAYGLGVDFALNPSKTIRLDIGYRGLMGMMNINDSTQKIDTHSYYILQNARINTYSGYIGLTFLF